MPPGPYLGGSSLFLLDGLFEMVFLSFFLVLGGCRFLKTQFGGSIPSETTRPAVELRNCVDFLAGVLIIQTVLMICFRPISSAGVRGFGNETEKMSEDRLKGPSHSSRTRK